MGQPNTLQRNAFQHNTHTRRNNTSATHQRSASRSTQRTSGKLRNINKFRRMGFYRSKNIAKIICNEDTRRLDVTKVSTRRHCDI